MKHVENPDTVAELLAVYQSALGCTVSQLIQQSAYYTVLGELQKTLNELLRYHGSTKRIEIEGRVKNSTRHISEENFDFCIKIIPAKFSIFDQHVDF